MASQHISQITFTSPPHHDADAADDNAADDCEGADADDGLNDDDDGDDGGGFADFTTNHLFSLLTASPTMPEPFYQFYTRVLPPILHQPSNNFPPILQISLNLPLWIFFWNSGWAHGDMVPKFYILIWV